MKNVINLYLDDSGVRHPQHRPGKAAGHGYDWFALGGVLVKDDDEPQVRQIYANFCSKWNITAPLHSSEIRSQNKGFHWLRSLSEEQKNEFYESLYRLLRDVPVIGLACVVDRPGYNKRYMAAYEQNPWMLCKTAFSVVAERAAKYARSSDRRLRIAPERCNKKEDQLLQSYYDDLKMRGLPFASDTSEKYGPLTPAQFRETLYEFEPKAKSSPMVQLADLYLWPICMGGYHASNRPYTRLMADGKLIECHVPQQMWPTDASKYSCFEGVVRKE